MNGWPCNVSVMPQITILQFIDANNISDFQEEFEDSTGNVVSKKIYEDLKRQGLL